MRLDPGTWLAAELERLRLDYEAGHAPARERALRWCTNNGWSPPPWLADALEEEHDRRPGRKGRAHSPAWRAEQALRHALRHDAVRYCLRVLREREGWAALSGADREGAAITLAGKLMFGAWAWGERRQIAASYRKVEAALKAGDGKVYAAALREPWATSA